MAAETPIPAAIEDMAWLAGRWVGSRGEGLIEEQWSAPAGGAMLGMFRSVTEGGPRFYELIALDAEGPGLVCRFKHFDRAMIGWEEKDAPLTLDLVELSPWGAVFLKRGQRRWMTYRRDAADTLTVFFEAEDEEHADDEEFRFVRG